MMKPLTFDSSDVGLIEATVSKLYSKLDIGAVGSCTRAQITRRVVAPGLGFDDLDYSFDIGYSGAAQDRIIICEVLSSTIRRVGEGHDEISAPVTCSSSAAPVFPTAASRTPRGCSSPSSILPSALRSPRTRKTACQGRCACSTT
ncbi:MAG TPA: hypothetical protein VGG25_00670, partial [Streptosporangiaceae bacterium]